MSRHQPLGGDANDAGQAQEGNRPAQNARLSTPGTLSTQGYQGGESAGDFLGLEAEMGASSGAFGLMADPGVQESESEPEPSAWVETDGVRERVEEEYEDDGQDESPHVDEEGEGEDLHGSWSESEPKRGGAGKLVGAVAGVLVLGALGVVGMKYMGSAGDGADTSEPIAATADSRTVRNAGLAAPVELEDVAETERTPQEQGGAALAPPPAQALAEGESVEPDPQSAREDFEATRGDDPPAWFDPSQDSQGQPASTGWSEEAEAVTRASIFVGDPIALLDAEGEWAQAPGEDSAQTTTADAGEMPLESAPVTIVALASEDAAQAPEIPSEEPATPTQTPSDVGEILSPVGTAPVVVASAPSPIPDAPVVSASAVESVGPAAPTGADALLPADGAVAGYHESRQSRTSSLKVEDVLLAPTMDSSNLRQAEAKDLSGVWSQISVPMQALDSKTKVLTPNVGRVRVVLKSKDIFEGRLYAVGQGSVWLESDFGRISVDGKRIASVANIDTKEGTPPLGATGSQNMTGLEKVRVKTPGGTFYGKVIARDDKETTLITEDGAKLTLANGDVEFLTDAPKVTIGGKVEETAKKP